MIIGVISDSHDRLPALKRAVETVVSRNVDAILHPGDFVAPFAAKYLTAPHVPDHIPVHCIYGNNDGERAGLKKILPQVQDGPYFLEVDGKRIAMHHWIEWFKDGDLDDADIVISGHTHEVVNETKDGKLYLNPGECCGWLTGRCTLAILDTDAMSAEIIEIDGD